jgi:hypothetical protein
MEHGIRVLLSVALFLIVGSILAASVNPDGAGFTNLHNFAVFGYDLTTGNDTNYDGANPQGLILYGATGYGATTGCGSGAIYDHTVFKDSNFIH